VEDLPCVPPRYLVGKDPWHRVEELGIACPGTPRRPSPTLVEAQRQRGHYCDSCRQWLRKMQLIARDNRSAEHRVNVLKDKAVIHVSKPVIDASLSSWPGVVFEGES
jgi:hypothetical protein